MTGFTAGGQITYDNGIGTPSFVAGTPYVIYASMALNFTVKASPICDGCTPMSKSTAYYSTSPFWIANP
jgi:hypothetical protein